MAAATVSFYGAPTFGIVRSFLPEWLLCSLVGIAFSLLVFRLFVALKIDRELPPAIVIYPNIALSCSLGLWLLIFN